MQYNIQNNGKFIAQMFVVKVFQRFSYVNIHLIFTDSINNYNYLKTFLHVA